MKKLLLLAFLFPAYAAMSQMGMCMHSMKNDSTFSLSSTKTIGASFLKFGELDDRIKGFSQYESLPEVLGTFGMGMVMHKGHFVAAHNLNFGYGKNGSNDEAHSTLAFVGVGADWGYNFFSPQSRLQLYPTVGLGAEVYRAKFKVDVSSTDFNAVLGDNSEMNEIRPVTLKNAYFTYRFGLNFGVESKKGDCSVGLQAGYVGSFNNRGWNVNENQTLANTPSDNLSRIYAGLFFAKDLSWGKGKHHGNKYK